jgi:hypothetical protein
VKSLTPMDGAMIHQLTKMMLNNSLNTNAYGSRASRGGSRVGGTLPHPTAQATSFSCFYLTESGSGGSLFPQAPHKLFLLC